MAEVVVAVLVTLDTKATEGRYVCAVLRETGARPVLVDLSLRPHDRGDADIGAEVLAAAAGTTLARLAELGRSDAASTMIEGGKRVLRGAFDRREIAGVIAVGGANNSTIACAMMRALPPLFPKAMVTPVAATAAVQWYVAESDIAMFPTIGDISMNRITRAVMANAARAVSAMASGWRAGDAPSDLAPLVGVSSFGGTQACVNRVSERLHAEGYEVIHFHSSGPGGRALESLARIGELCGVVDVTTSELVDMLLDGVYSAGADRLSAAGAAGLPQVVVPGALDHCNFWVDEAPERFRHREFVQYNVEILLMRTNAEEYERLGRLVAERLNAARGPYRVLIPTRGFSQHTTRRTTDLDGNELGRWYQPDTDRIFADTLERHLAEPRVERLDLHINDAEFADACAEAFLAMRDEAPAG